MASNSSLGPYLMFVDKTDLVRLENVLATLDKAEYSFKGNEETLAAAQGIAWAMQFHKRLKEHLAKPPQVPEQIPVESVELPPEIAVSRKGKRK